MTAGGAKIPCYSTVLHPPRGLSLTTGRVSNQHHAAGGASEAGQGLSGSIRDCGKPLLQFGEEAEAVLRIRVAHERAERRAGE